MVQLLLPTWCPGCGYGGVSLCRGCAKGFSHWFRAEAGADALPPGLPVWAAAAYAHEVARIVMAWKSGHRPDLAAPLHRLGHRLGMRLGASKAFRDLTAEIAIVPAPSGWRRRWGGKEVVAPLAHEVSRGLLAAGHQAMMVPALHRRGGNRHHLARAERLADRAESISLRRLPPRRAEVGNGDRFVVLVDDVLTTGATLAASAAAARGLGPVLGAIVLAATPKPVYRDAQIRV